MSFITKLFKKKQKDKRVYIVRNIDNQILNITLKSRILRKYGDPLSSASWKCCRIHYYGDYLNISAIKLKDIDTSKKFYIIVETNGYQACFQNLTEALKDCGISENNIVDMNLDINFKNTNCNIQYYEKNNGKCTIIEINKI